jgi:hypothetical protein
MSTRNLSSKELPLSVRVIGAWERTANAGLSLVVPALVPLCGLPWQACSAKPPASPLVQEHLEELADGVVISQERHHLAVEVNLRTRLKALKELVLVNRLPKVDVLLRDAAAAEKFLVPRLLTGGNDLAPSPFDLIADELDEPVSRWSYHLPAPLLRTVMFQANSPDSGDGVR